MPYSAYPTGADVDAKLTAAGVDTTGLDTDSAIGAAIASFERQTGRVPMLAGEATTRLFNPPTGAGLVMSLNNDLAALPDTVTVNGLAMIEGTDYWCEDTNAPQFGWPFQRIRWSIYRWPMNWAVQLPQWVNSIAITGQWGYGLTLPDDAWTAMVELACVELYQEAANAATGYFKTIKVGSGDREVTYADVSALVARWEKRSEKTIKVYTRWIQ